MITLVTGGARSGKSRHALELASTYGRKAFIATCEPFDEEMRRRVAAHREERDASYQTFEEPRDLASALARLPAEVEVAVIDCLTVWLGNLTHHAEPGADLSQLSTFPEIAAFLARLDDPPACDLIVVTNEVGMGLVPTTAMGRAYRDLAGTVNQRVAARAERVILMVSGIPFEGSPAR